MIPDDIDPDAKMRVRGKLEAHFPDIPNPEQYDPMAIIVRYMREAGMEVDMTKVRECEAWLVAKACEMFPNEHNNPFASRLKPLAAAAKVIVESTPNLMQIPRSPQLDKLFAAPSGPQWVVYDSTDGVIGSDPTGRIIVKDEPQLQNLPLRTPEGARLRKAWTKAWNEPEEG